MVTQADLLLPDGTISLTGGGLNRRPPGGADPTSQNDMAVIGGTGAYAGATGTATLTASGPTAQRLDIKFAP